MFQCAQVVSEALPHGFRGIQREPQLLLTVVERIAFEGGFGMSADGIQTQQKAFIRGAGSVRQVGK